jgi:hypothetical protein
MGDVPQVHLAGKFRAEWGAGCRRMRYVFKGGQDTVSSQALL